jgi:uncharacterized surface protein with fasciclin (FAS1) repeats
MTRTLALFTIVALFALTATSFAENCASNSNSSNATLATNKGTTSMETEVKDIVTTAINAGSFNTLVAAVKAAGLVETLQGPGPFTVFAPNDAAFAKVPKETLDALLADKAKLTAVLTYHVVAGNVMAADAVKLDGKEAATVNGQSFKIAVKNGEVMVDNAKVIATDIKCSNGVIHVIDSVILPK